MSSGTRKKKLSISMLIAGAIGLFAAALAVYFSALQGEFVYDDLRVIQQNPQISSLANIPGIFASSYWDFLDAESASHVGYYRPLTMVLITVGFAIGDGSPEAFHVLSLLVYGLACVVAWRFAARLLESEGAGFWAALLFTLHPLHVESVAWISALHDPLYAFFGFLALLHYLRWRDEGSSGRPWVAGLWFFLSLLSKDSAVAFLPILLVIEWGQKPALNSNGLPAARRYLRALSPFCLAFAGYYALRVMVFGDLLAGFDRVTTDFGVGAVRLALLRVELLGGAMWLLTWPAELNLFRPFHPEFPEGAASLVIGSIGSLVLVLLIAVAWLRRSRLGLTLLLLIPAALAPVFLRVESLGTFPLSDRFLFVPVLGFTGLIAHFLWSRLPRSAASALLAVIAVALGARTVAQVPHWADEEALFRNAVAQNDRNPNVHWGLGRVMLNHYSQSGLSDDLIEARHCFERAMDLLEEASTTGKDIYATHDDHLQTNLGLGHALLREAEVDPFHDYELVRKIFEEVIKYQPQSERGHIGLGVTWLAAGDPNLASNEFRRAIELNPNSPEAHFNMGILLMRIEEWAAAAKEFERSLSLRNNNRKDLVFLARALVESGETPRAQSYAQRALEIFPDDSDSMVLLGTIAARGKNQAKALAWFDRALEIAPNHGAAHLQRGNALATLKQNKGAVEALMEACRLIPQSFEAHYNLMVLLLASDNPESALPFFFVAYQKRPQNFANRMYKVAQAIPQDDVTNLVMLATIDADRDDLKTAIGWMERAIEVAPEDGPSNYIYGVLLRKLESEEAALPYLLVATELLPDSYQAQFEYADALLQLNRYVQAEPILKRALILLPNENMDPEVMRPTEEIIRKALKNIHDIQNADPPAPDGN